MATKMAVVLSLSIVPFGQTTGLQQNDSNTLLSENNIVRTHLSAPQDSGDSRPDGLDGLVFGPDGYTVITGTTKYGGKVAVRIWDLRTANSAPVELGGHTGPLDALALSGDGNLLATGDYDGTVRVWDLASEPVRIAGFQWFRYQVTALALSRQGHLLAASGDGGAIGLLDVRNPSEKPAILEGPTNGVTYLDFSPDGESLVASSADGFIRVWSTDQTASPPVLLRAHEPDTHPANDAYDRNHVNEVKFSRDGRLLVAGANDGSIQIWDATQLARAPTKFQAHDGSVDSFSLNHDATLLATSGRDRMILLWNLADLDVPPRLIADLKTDWATKLAFDPQSEHLFALIDERAQLFHVHPITPQTILVQ